MPGWLKALLIVAVVIVVLVVGVIVAGAVWWSRNKDAVIGRAKEVVAEGREFGGNSDNQGCVNEAISRYKKERGFGSAISTSVFMRTCLEASRPTQGFCSEVPRKTEFIKSAEWRTSQCRRVDLSSDRYCPQLFEPVQEFCERTRSSADSNSQ